MSERPANAAAALFGLWRLTGEYARPADAVSVKIPSVLGWKVYFFLAGSAFFGGS